MGEWKLMGRSRKYQIRFFHVKFLLFSNNLGAPSPIMISELTSQTLEATQLVKSMHLEPERSTQEGSSKIY